MVNQAFVLGISHVEGVATINGSVESTYAAGNIDCRRRAQASDQGGVAVQIDVQGQFGSDNEPGSQTAALDDVNTALSHGGSLRNSIDAA
eukprot:COSAG02_NODE_61220_length_269_cov_0.611765_1_plen_89_part_11